MKGREKWQRQQQIVIKSLLELNPLSLRKKESRDCYYCEGDDEEESQRWNRELYFLV